jgi:GT2 family glycosyltransferase
MLPVVIPYYRRPDQLERCLTQLRLQGLDLEVFIWDNSERNLYFTEAVNRGLSHYLDHPVEAVLVLNQDVYLELGALRCLLEFMRTRPACGIATPMQVDPHDPESVRVGPTTQVFPVGRWFTGRVGDYDAPVKVPWADGACLLLRKSMIREIGLLDRNLRLLASDSDYSFTARSRGWQTWWVPAARARHERGISASRGSPEIELVKVQDQIYFIRKWLTGDLVRRLAAPFGPPDVAEVEAVLRELLARRAELAQAGSAP